MKIFKYFIKRNTMICWRNLKNIRTISKLFKRKPQLTLIEQILIEFLQLIITKPRIIQVDFGMSLKEVLNSSKEILNRKTFYIEDYELDTFVLISLNKIRKHYLNKDKRREVALKLIYSFKILSFKKDKKIRKS